MTSSSEWGALPGLSRVESPGGGNLGGAAAGWELCPRTWVRPTRGQGREPPRGGARGSGSASGPMASLGCPLGLLLWLLLLQPRVAGTQGGSAPPPPSPAPTSQSSSGGGREGPGASVWRAEGPPVTPGPQEAAASPQVVAVTPGASGSYRAVATAKPLTTAKPLFPAGDVSGSGPAAETWPGPRGPRAPRGPGLCSGGGSHAEMVFRRGVGGSEGPQPCA